MYMSERSAAASTRDILREVRPIDSLKSPQRRMLTPLDLND